MRAIVGAAMLGLILVDASYAVCKPLPDNNPNKVFCEALQSNLERYLLNCKLKAVDNPTKENIEKYLEAAELLVRSANECSAVNDSNSKKEKK